MKAWIYQIYNTITSQRYIGSSTDLEGRKNRHFSDLHNNKHHNIYLQRSYNKHGPAAFTFDILCEVDITESDEIRLIEQQYLDCGDNLYNIGKHATGGDNISDHPNRDGIQQRKGDTIRTKRGLMSTDERKEKFGRRGERNGMYGRTHTDEVKKKLSQAGKERVGNAEMSSIGQLRTGKTNAELYGNDKAAEISQKLSTYGKQRVGDKNPFFGKCHTDEFKQRSSESRKAQHNAMTVWDKLNHPQMKPILIDNVLYFGCAEAARTIGCTPGNITYKLKSDKYPNYQYISKDEAVQYLQTLSILHSKDLSVDPNSKISDNISNEQ